MKVIIYEDRGGEWRWRAVDGNHRVIADSAEGYITRQGAIVGLDNVMNEFRGEVQVLATRLQYLPHGHAKALHADAEVIEAREYEPVAEYQAEGDHDALTVHPESWSDDQLERDRLKMADEDPDGSQR